MIKILLYFPNSLCLCFLLIFYVNCYLFQSCIALYLWLCVISLFQQLADRLPANQVSHCPASARLINFNIKCFTGLGIEAKIKLCPKLQGDSEWRTMSIKNKLQIQNVGFNTLFTKFFLLLTNFVWYLIMYLIFSCLKSF